MEYEKAYYKEVTKMVREKHVRYEKRWEPVGLIDDNYANQHSNVDYCPVTGGYVYTPDNNYWDNL